jgi:hypothetical protein
MNIRHLTTVIIFLALLVQVNAQKVKTAGLQAT